MNAVPTPGLSNEELFSYASESVSGGACSLERLFQDFCVCDAANDHGQIVSIDGEIYVPSDNLPFTFSQFLDWAVGEGLLVVTEKGDTLRTQGFALDPSDAS